MIKIKKAKPHEIKDVYIKEWHADFIVTKGNIIKYNDVKGFTAKKNNNLLGLITYIKRGNEIEIISFNSFLENKGVGARLLEYVIKKFNKKNIKRIFLITTNDNLKALRFYQKKNFIIKNIHINSIEKSRIIKPEIPVYGMDGIEIRDEIELEYKMEE